MLLIVLYSVIIPLIYYSKKQFLTGLFSLIFGIIITYLSNSILPKVFHWSDNLLIIIIPMAIITYAITIFISLFVSSKR